MWKPSEYSQAFLMLLCSMLCWGSWANALKLMKKCRFELFYWDYVFGTTFISIVLGLTMGSYGKSGPSLFADFRQSSAASFEYAFAGGAVFNAANILLTGAIEVAGLAVAFPLGVGLSIIIGVILNYWITPKNDPILLFGGVTLLLGAIVLDAMAYRNHSAVSKKPTSTGLLLCVISGIGLGLFYPLVAKSMAVHDHLGPYSIGIVFMLGMFLSNFVLNTAVMVKPVTGQAPLPLGSYFRMPRHWHVLGFLLGGAVWGLGTVFNFVASSTPLVGPATSFALGDGATMVSAIWGVAVWKEFAGASSKVRLLVTLMFLFFVLGLSSIALSPILAVMAKSR